MKNYLEIKSLRLNGKESILKSVRISRPQETLDGNRSLKGLRAPKSSSHSFSPFGLWKWPSAVAWLCWFLGDSPFRPKCGRHPRTRGVPGLALVSGYAVSVGKLHSHFSALGFGPPVRNSLRPVYSRHPGTRAAKVCEDFSNSSAVPSGK